MWTIKCTDMKLCNGLKFNNIRYAEEYAKEHNLSNYKFIYENHGT